MDQSYCVAPIFREGCDSIMNECYVGRVIGREHSRRNVDTTKVSCWRKFLCDGEQPMAYSFQFVYII